MAKLLLIVILLSGCASQSAPRQKVIQNFDRDAYFETKVREDYIEMRSYGYY